MKRTLSLLAVVLLGLSLTACSTVTSWMSDIESAVSTTDTTQDATNVVYYASELYTIAATTVTTAVAKGAFTTAQLTKLQELRANVRTALDAMKAAQAAGTSVDTAAFTLAWTAFKTYLTTLGINLTADARTDEMRLAIAAKG